MDIKSSLTRVETVLGELKDYKPTLASKIKIQGEGYDVESEPTPTMSDLEYLARMIGYLREDFGYLREQLYNHYEGHIPKIVGATAMTKALKALGIDGDYKVMPQVVYASDGTVEKILLEVMK